MGQRTINTIIRLQNESEYKTALKNCTSELKVMKSELDKVTSEYRTNANSMDALAAKGDVLSKMYAAQSQKVDLLRGALEKAKGTQAAETQTVESLRQQYDEAKETLKAYGDELGESSEEYKEQKDKVDKLRDAIIQHEARLESSTKSVNYYSTQLNRAEVELDRLTDQQEENNDLLREAKNSADGCATSIDRYGDAVRDAADGTGQSISAVEGLAGAMAASGIQQKVEDVAAAMKEASEAAQTYELSLAQVSTIADETVVSSEEMRAGILEISTELRKDANEVAGAVYDALSSGVDTAGVLEFVSQSTQLATAGFTDMGTSVDVLTTILNAYRLESSETEKVASTLVKTQDLGKVTVDQLGNVLGRIIPSAAAYGVNLDNIAAAYANMTAAGINAENTTTYLSTMLDELADNGSTVAAVLKEQTGKSFAELMAEGYSLGDVLEVLGASVNYDNVQFSNLWSRVTAGKAAISLFNGSADDFNATLAKMASSSGTVAANYEKMIDVSDYSSQRLSVASKNLEIAIGDQLNPVLDRLREAGANILESATEFVTKNPAVVSCIAGLVTALGLLATGLSALMIAKSVAAAMQALNIAMAANPAVLIAVGIAGLVAALATYAAQSESTAEKVEELTVASQALNDTVAGSSSTYLENVAAASAAVSTVEQYIARLEELEAQGLKTDAQQQEYAMLVEKINSVIPELNAEIDKQTGLVKGGTDALLDHAAAWHNAAIAEAAYTRYKEDIEAVAAAEYELAKNQALLSMAEDDATAITKKRNAVMAVLDDNLREQERIQNNATLSYEDASNAMSELLSQEDTLRHQLADLDAQLGENESQQSALNQAIEESNQIIAASQDEVNAATEAYNNLAGASETTAETVGESSGEMAGAVTDANQQIQAAYAETYAAARKSLDGQIGLFDEVSGKCEMSAEDMIANLKSQEEAFNNYADNLTKAMEMGIDIGLVQKLSDGSVESMQILDVLVNDTSRSVDEINEAFGGMSAAKDTAARAMTDVQVAVNAGMDDIADDLYASGKEAGGHLGDGLIVGINGKIAAYELAVSNLANAGVQTYSRVNMTHSPSKRYEKLAHWDVEGLIVQYKEETPRLQTAASDMADAGYSAAVQARRASIPALVSAASTMQSADNTQINSLLQQILAAVKAGKKLVLDSGALVGATASQYDEQMGYRKMLADRGAM